MSALTKEDRERIREGHRLCPHRLCSVCFLLTDLDAAEARAAEIRCANCRAPGIYYDGPGARIALQKFTEENAALRARIEALEKADVEPEGAAR